MFNNKPVRFGAQSAAEAARRRAAERQQQDPTSEAQWIRLRAPQRPQDTELSRPAIAWVAALPRSLRPTQLCQDYPRVANRLALCWADPLLAARLLEDLLIDRRGSRRGFPPPIALELMRLREHGEHARGADGADPSPWDLGAQATADR